MFKKLRGYLKIIKKVAEVVENVARTVRLVISVILGEKQYAAA